MNTEVDDITIAAEEDGVLVIKELKKAVITRGTWPTILFRYQEWDAKRNCYGEEKYSLRRYQKIGDGFKQQAKFNILNKEQALKILEILNEWIKEAP